MAILDADKLAIYNKALAHLGGRQLASLTEAREPRRVLDLFWGADDDLPRYCLSKGEWNFAIRSRIGVYSPSIEPPFGFRRAYDKPSDMVRLAGLSANEYFHQPLTNDQYVDEAGYWFTNYDTIYIRHVSDDTDYGFDSSKWVETFKEYMGYRLARLACVRLTNSKSERDRLKQEERDALKIAKSRDAMDEGVKFHPAGSWVRARTSTRGSYDR